MISYQRAFNVDPLLPIREHQVRLLASAQAEDPTMPPERQMPLAFKLKLFELISRDRPPVAPGMLPSLGMKPPTLQQWAKAFGESLWIMVSNSVMLRPTEAKPFRYAPGKENEYIKRFKIGEQKRRTERVEEIMNDWLGKLAPLVKQEAV